MMGSYGIGPARIAASAVEQNHDEAGIIWPASLAPFHVHMVVIGGADEPQFAIARDIQAELERGGLAVLFDDRVGRPGREVRRCGADRMSRAGDGREAHGDRRDRPTFRFAAGATSVRYRSAKWRPPCKQPSRRRSIRAGVLMAKSASAARSVPFDPGLGELMAQAGVSYRRLAEMTELSAGLPEPSRPRQPAAAGRPGDRADRERPGGAARPVPGVPDPADRRGPARRSAPG